MWEYQGSQISTFSEWGKSDLLRDNQLERIYAASRVRVQNLTHRQLSHTTATSSDNRKEWINVKNLHKNVNPKLLNGAICQLELRERRRKFTNFISILFLFLWLCIYEHNYDVYSLIRLIFIRISQGGQPVWLEAKLQP